MPVLLEGRRFRISKRRRRRERRLDRRRRDPHAAVALEAVHGRAAATVRAEPADRIDANAHGPGRRAADLKERSFDGLKWIVGVADVFVGFARLAAEEP